MTEYDPSSSDNIADSFSRDIGVSVFYDNVSWDISGGNKFGYWRIEDDSSIKPKGLEFITPDGGLPVDVMITKMEEVRDWALKNDYYTNESTGLHINVSVPNYHISTVDYVKLVLLLGDEKVLNDFGRLGNTEYTASSLRLIKDKAQSNPGIVLNLLDKMKSKLSQLGANMLQGAVPPTRYFSVNPRENYVEFRSPGGNWLNYTYWSKVEETMLRFIVVLDAAVDPEKYREEYLKKLYKVLSPVIQDKNTSSLGQLLAKYIAGQITKDEFISDYYGVKNFDKSASVSKNTGEPTNTPTSRNFPDGNSRYEVYKIDGDQVLGTFLYRSGDREGAREQFRNFLNRHSITNPVGYGWREMS
jgi:hypothetical protein